MVGGQMVSVFPQLTPVWGTLTLYYYDWIAGHRGQEGKGLAQGTEVLVAIHRVPGLPERGLDC